MSDELFDVDVFDFSFFSDDFDVDAKVESYLNLYNKSQAQTTRNATPEGATGGKGDNYVKDIIKQASELAKSQRFGGD